uniref:Uncharacterized protein n=1 Tax=viral metagenome TaxID=1070528 RepID=A0A6C0LHU2_9ZZZZ
MFKVEGGGEKVYTSKEWYQYEANRLIHNTKNIKNTFPGRSYINAEDIVDHIAYCKYGCFLLLEELRHLKKKLKIIEDQIKNGFWIKKDTASVSKLTSDNINLFIDNITNITKLNEFTTLIHEDIYMSYFFTTRPNIFLPDPKVPNLPPLPRQTVNIDNKDNIISLIKDTIPYLNILEKYHMSVYRLISAVSEGLEDVITR